MDGLTLPMLILSGWVFVACSSDVETQGSCESGEPCSCQDGSTGTQVCENEQDPGYCLCTEDGGFDAISDVSDVTDLPDRDDVADVGEDGDVRGDLDVADADVPQSPRFVLQSGGTSAVGSYLASDRFTLVSRINSTHQRASSDRFDFVGGF